MQCRRLLGSTFVVFFQPVSSFPLFVVCHLSQKVMKVDSDLIDFDRDLKEVNRTMSSYPRELRRYSSKRGVAGSSLGADTEF